MSKLFYFVAILFFLPFLTSAKPQQLNYSDYLNETATNNLRTAEASQMVYNIYENFIIPRICEDTRRTKADENGKGSHKRLTCSFLPYTNIHHFEKVKEDPTGILYRATKPIKELYGYKFTDKAKLEDVAPKNYAVTYVGCFRKTKNNQTKQLTDCSLFFSISESAHFPPILSVKGTSNKEDWSNNYTMGSSVFHQITGAFVNLLGDMHDAIIPGESQKTSSDIETIAPLLADFVLMLTQNKSKIFFTGHSLGGALTQELAREIYVASKQVNASRNILPKFEVITWNSLSYTTMLGRLSKGLGKVFDATRWHAKDATHLADYKKDFDGIHLSAVNFHTADDALTQLINYSFIGKLSRLDDQKTFVQAGLDILLPTDRYIVYGSLLSKIAGHGINTCLHDLLFATGATKQKDGTFHISTFQEQKEFMNRLAEKQKELAAEKRTPEYFRQNAYNTNEYDRYDGRNFDLDTVYREIHNDLKRSEEYVEMMKILERNAPIIGRLNQSTQANDQIQSSLYQ